jgi:hypothetical protein
MDGGQMVLSRPQRQVRRSQLFTRQTTTLLSLHEELASVRVLSAISHRKEKGLIVFEREIFIVEGTAVDRFSSGAITIRKVAGLNHKVFHDSMEHYSLENGMRVLIFYELLR